MPTFTPSGQIQKQFSNRTPWCINNMMTFVEVSLMQHEHICWCWFKMPQDILSRCILLNASMWVTTLGMRPLKKWSKWSLNQRKPWPKLGRQTARNFNWQPLKNSHLLTCHKQFSADTKSSVWQPEKKQKNKKNKVLAFWTPMPSVCAKNSTGICLF